MSHGPRGDVAWLPVELSHWASEQTIFAREVGEAALAHSNPDRVERTYKGATLFENGGSSWRRGRAIAKPARAGARAA
jgi:hypothetical protein